MIVLLRFELEMMSYLPPNIQQERCLTGFNRGNALPGGAVESGPLSGDRGFGVAYPAKRRIGRWLCNYPYRTRL